MALVLKSPDVYVEEISVFPPSVAEVGTAIPAFVGYTERAEKSDGENLDGRPTKVRSLAEFTDWYGGVQRESRTVSVVVETVDVLDESGQPKKEGAKSVRRATGEYRLSDAASQRSFVPKFVLPWSIRAYFENGGVECYIVSVGQFGKPVGAPGSVDKQKLLDGFDAVAKEDEPTLLVSPDAQALSADDYSAVASKVLKQCGDLRDRFAILDLHQKAGANEAFDVTAAREKVGAEHLKYGALYHPPLRTNYEFAIDATKLNLAVAALPNDVSLEGGHSPAAGSSETLETVEKGKAGTLAQPAVGPNPAVAAVAAQLPNTALASFVRRRLAQCYAVLPPSGAVAGIFAATDAARGVWKAPANVGVANVIEPTIRIDSKGQEELNVDPTSGKSINVIRSFAGYGPKLWGARTLAGNDNEWRYVSVRRFFNMVEESVKKSTYWAVFEPNDANTWVKVRGMIENFLIDKWRDGALAGATPKDAFFVKCGLGTTMNSQDILQGKLNVEIGLAVVRPAEFIVLRFSHKLQVS